MTVTADTDLTTLTVDQINWLLEEGSYGIEVDWCEYVQVNASNEYQYNVTYNSSRAGEYVSNHAFVHIDAQGDPVLIINDMDIQPSLFD